MTIASPNNTQRLMALDVFRGLTVALMVLVSNPGNAAAIYTQLDHAAWNGWTLTDVVFPSFLWIVGVSITLSTDARLSRNLSKRAILLSGLRRSLILYLVGVLIYAIPTFDLSTLRFMGVLQRIALCSFAATWIYLGRRVHLIVLWIVGLIASYWVLLRFIPSPGFAAGDLTVDGNLAHYVDRVVLGSHNYVGTGTWDPEGILSTLPALATTLFGLLAGVLIQKQHSTVRQRSIRLLLIGVALVILGLACSHWMPINKKLWTDSFCLLMAGIDFMLFAGLFWLLDGLKIRAGTTLPLAFGKNALAVYILSETTGAILYSIHSHGRSVHDAIFQSVFTGIASPQTNSLLYALTFLAVISVVAIGLYRRSWFLKI